MTPTEERGKRIVLIYSGVILVVSATAIILYVSTHGVEQLPMRIIRFALTVLLLIGLYRGSRMVRAILLFLFGFGGIQALWSAFQTSDVLGRTAIGCLAAIYLAFTATLAMDPAVDAFLRHQKLPTLTEDA